MSSTDSGTPGESAKRVSPHEYPASGEQAAVPPAVELRSISKDFGSNRALDGVDLRIGHGEVVGLLGQNGSGKSTLVKVLSGVYDPEPGGRLFVGGEEIPLPLAPGQASEIGLSFVYQNLALAGGLSVLENLTLGQRIAGGLRSWRPINWLAEHRRAAAVLDRYDVTLDLDRRTGDLAPVDQARLAIVRAAEDLRRYRTRSGYTHSVLVLDEPTVFLPEEEVDRLFDLIRTVVAEGAAVLFISHDLAAVPRDHRPCRRAQGRPGRRRGGHGRHPRGGAGRPHRRRVGAAGRGRPGGSGPGRRPARGRADAGGDGVRRRRAGPGENVIVEHLTDARLHDLSFEIGAGEILGVAGLIGSGAEDLPYLLFGAQQAVAGTLRLGTEALDVGGLSPQRSVRERVALVPADRAVQGLSQSLTLWENIVMLVEDEHYRGGVFHRGELVALAPRGHRPVPDPAAACAQRRLDLLRRQPAEGPAGEVAARPAEAAAAARADAGRRRRCQAGHLPFREISR